MGFTKSKANFINYLIIFGSSIFILGLLLVFLIFFPVIKEEMKYAFRNGSGNPTPTKIKPVSTDFGIVIPKILANAKIIDNVDPFNSKEYQLALTKGVARAIGTAYPGQIGNTFLFAHSSSNWYTANQYNSVFYLVSKLENKDEIDIYFKNKKYIYQVFEKKIVEANQIQYLNNNLGSTRGSTPTNESILTLMTCWPAGTNLKRLIIWAKISLDK